MGWQIVVWELNRYAATQIGYLLRRRKVAGPGGGRAEGHARRSYQALMHHYGQIGRHANRQE